MVVTTDAVDGFVGDPDAAYVGIVTNTSDVDHQIST
jgi:hypothetical protein